MPLPTQFQAFWADAKARLPTLDGTRFYEAFSFGDSSQLADSLAELVLQGRKRATAGLLWVFEAEGKPVPRPGDLSLVTSESKMPLCIIETTAVEVVPFNRVGEDFARTEGEDDGTLESWRANHTIFFGRECARIGRAPAADMPVVCERFQVVYQPGISTREV